MVVVVVVVAVAVVLNSDLLFDKYSFLVLWFWPPVFLLH